MIDLKAMEEKLDAVLSQETAESLEMWLFKQRNKKVSNIIGKGSFVSLNSISVLMDCKKRQSVFSRPQKVSDISESNLAA